ncbi:MAG: tyrosine-type recombinase/integrase [Solirubrobacteraceae bacterium]|nr:tyrosine-type recombinase/integrase [Solirubrobacteraceae bacterium]
MAAGRDSQGRVARSSRRGIERRSYLRADGRRTTTYRVRFVDAVGRKRSATFDRQSDAEDFQARIRLERRGGRIDDLDRGRELLRDFVEQTWWPQRAGDLAVSTQTAYQRHLNHRILPRIGDMEIREIRPRTVSALKAEIERELVAAHGPGRGAPTVRKVLAVLQSVMADAVRWQLVDVNPVQPIAKPPAAAMVRAVHPPTVEQVEILRGLVGHEFSRVLIAVLAYTGLRPQEALALQWRHVRERTILIEQRLSAGQLEAGQKSRRRRPRTVRMVGPVHDDLRAWRRHLDDPPAGAFVFARQDGRHLTETGYRNWRRIRFQDARDRAGFQQSARRPYDLRHLCASLLLAAGTNVQEVANQMGHTLEMLSQTYAHVIDDLAGQPPIDLDDHITTARAKAAPQIAEILETEARDREQQRAEKLGRRQRGPKKRKGTPDA